MFLLMFTAVKAINKAVRFQNSKFTKMESRRNRQRKSKSSDYLSQFVTSNRKSDSERTKRFSGAFSFESSYTNRNPKLKYKKKGVRAEKGIGGGEKKPPRANPNFSKRKDWGKETGKEKNGEQDIKVLNPTSKSKTIERRKESRLLPEQGGFPLFVSWMVVWVWEGSL